MQYRKAKPTITVAAIVGLGCNPVVRVGTPIIGECTPADCKHLTERLKTGIPSLREWNGHEGYTHLLLDCDLYLVNIT